MENHNLLNLLLPETSKTTELGDISKSCRNMESMEDFKGMEFHF